MARKTRNRENEKIGERMETGEEGQGGSIVGGKGSSEEEREAGVKEGRV